MTDRSRLRIVVLRALVLSLLLTLVGRLWYLQVLAAPTYDAAAADNQTRDIVTAAPRGEIVDDQGTAFVTNTTALVISVDRIALLRQADGGKAVIARLSSLLHLPVATLDDKLTLCGPKAPRGCWNGSPYEPIPVSQFSTSIANTERALQIMERPELYPGVTAQQAAVRTYPKPSGALASQLLGYVAPITQAQLAKLPQAQQDAERSAQVGVQGVEQQYNAALQGTPGITQVAVDHLGAVTGTLSSSAPQPGDTLVTSLNAKVQASLEQQLQAAITLARHTPGRNGGPADWAAGVVMNVQTGQIIAMGSVPTYQPDAFNGGISEKDYEALQSAPGTPLFDKSFEATAPPGSSFKLISTAGLLWDGTGSINGTYDCSSSFGGKHNFEGEAYGPITLHETIVKSCDTVYYRLANADWNNDQALISAGKKAKEGVQKIARMFGIGEDPKVDLPNAATGHIADRNNTKLEWQQIKKQYCEGAKNPRFSPEHRAADQEFCDTGYVFEPGDQENEDIGQGSVLASPLQMAVAYSALANGGTVFEPRVAEALVDPSGAVVQKVTAPVRDHLPVSTADLDYIRNAMYDVPVSGTGASAFAGFPMGQVKVGGKTGTAEVGANAQYSDSWFASFAGKAGGKPQYVCVIIIDKGGQGGVTAAPEVRTMWDDIFGLEGHKAELPGGVAPTALPKLASTSGVIPPVASTPTPASTPTSPGVSALGVPPALPVRTDRTGLERS